MLATLISITVATPTLFGLNWETSFDSALARAKKENKPIFALDVIGRLDQEFC